MSRNRMPRRSMPSPPAPDESCRPIGVLEREVRRGILWLRDQPLEDWQATVACLEETSDDEEQAVTRLVLEWLKRREIPPDTPDWLRVKLLARWIHALHLHRQLELAPPPGHPPWPTEQALSPAQWLWLLVDSWRLENVPLVICYLWCYQWPGYDLE